MTQLKYVFIGHGDFLAAGILTLDKAIELITEFKNRSSGDAVLSLNCDYEGDTTFQVYWPQPETEEEKLFRIQQQKISKEKDLARKLEQYRALRKEFGDINP